MSDSNKLNEEQLNEVSGGAAGKTTTGYQIMKNGTVIIAKDGKTLAVSAADYQWLLNKYPGTLMQKEADLASVPLIDIERMIDEKNSPFK